MTEVDFNKNPEEILKDFGKRLESMKERINNSVPKSLQHYYSPSDSVSLRTHQLIQEHAKKTTE